MLEPIAALQPLRLGTPLEDHLAEAGLLVKREDLSCPPPGPPFSKTRGVLAHMAKRRAEGVKLFGALDTFHSQAGHAVAHAARLLDAQCINFFPVYKKDARAPRSGEGVPAGWVGVDAEHFVKLRDPQMRSAELGAELVGLPAGRSAVLYHQAKRECEARGGYMMPNSLKLSETVQETAAEVIRTFELAPRDQFDLLRSSPWLISVSSATIASGVILGLSRALGTRLPPVILHMGYSRSVDALRAYVAGHLGWDPRTIALALPHVIDEGYAYADQARPGPTPPWPSNPYYDLKAVRWWLREGRAAFGPTAVHWSIG